MAIQHEYSNSILLAVKPEDAAELMKERLWRGQNLNDEIADWIRDRAKIERVYASELDKLSKRPAPQLSATMGSLQPIWKAIVKSVEESSAASNDLSIKLRSDVEAPLRQFGRSGEIQDVRMLQDGLSQLAQTLQKNEDVHHKATTARNRNPTEIDEAQMAVVETQSQWENQAPFAFDQFEGADLSRLVLLKEVLTTMGTAEVERAQKAIRNNEDNTNKVLSFDPMDEIKSFANQIASGNAADVGITGPRERAQRHQTEERGLVSQINRTSTVDSHDGLYERPSFSRNDDASTHSKDSRVKLRSRVGSIFRSKKKEKERRQQFVEPIAEVPAPVASHTTGSSRQSSTEPSSQAPVTTTSGVTRRSSGNNTARSRQSLPPPPPPQPRKANGIAREDLPPVPKSEDVDSEGYTIPKTTGIGYDNVPGVSNGYHNVDSDDQQNQNGPFRVDISQNVIKEEGDLDDDDVALSTVASKLRARPTVSGRSNRGRRDIQSRLFTGLDDSNDAAQDQVNGAPTTAVPAPADPPSYPANEPREAAIAPAVMAPPVSQTQTVQPVQPGQSFMNQLQSFPAQTSPTHPPPSFGLPPLPTQVTPQQQQQSLPISPIQYNAQQPISPMRAQTFPISPSTEAAPLQHQVSGTVPSAASPETQSLYSMKSNTSSALFGSSLKHPALPIGTPLVATIAELVNAQVKDGVLERAQIVGEVSIGYNGEPTSAIDLKLQNAEHISQIIPNSNIIHPQGPNNYRVNGIDSITGVPTGVLAFKYLVRSSSKVPVVFTPIWRIEEKQASLMFTYKLDDSITVPVAIEELLINVSLQGGEALSAQTKPVGAFNKEQQRLIWRFTEPHILNPGVEEKLLCRFMTSSQVHEAPQGLDIKFRVSGATSSNLQLLYNSGAASDPFGDQSETENWKEANVTHTVSTAKYTASSENNVKFM